MDDKKVKIGDDNHYDLRCAQISMIFSVSTKEYSMDDDKVSIDVFRKINNLVRHILNNIPGILLGHWLFHKIPKKGLQKPPKLPSNCLLDCPGPKLVTMNYHNSSIPINYHH